jgi:hypothetical protein
MPKKSLLTLATWHRQRCGAARQGNGTDAFIVHLTDVYPQSTGQRLSTSSLICGFLDGIMKKEGL